MKLAGEPRTREHARTGARTFVRNCSTTSYTTAHFSQAGSQHSDCVATVRHSRLVHASQRSVRMSLSHRTRVSRRDAVMLEGMEMARIPLRLRGSCPCALVRRAYFERNDLFGAKKAVIVIIKVASFLGRSFTPRRQQTRLAPHNDIRPTP